MTESELLEKAAKLAGPHTLDFIQQVDRSAFGLESWLDAYETFAVWLRERGRPVEFSPMLGYLSCCAKSVEGKNYPLDLKDVTSEMLETHGFDGSLS